MRTIARRPRGQSAPAKPTGRRRRTVAVAATAGALGAAGTGVAFWRSGALSKVSPSQMLMLALTLLATMIVLAGIVWIVTRCILGAIDRLTEAAKQPNQGSVSFSLGEGGRVAKLELEVEPTQSRAPAPPEKPLPLKAPPLGRPELVPPPDQTVEGMDGDDSDQDPKDPPSRRRRAQ